MNRIQEIREELERKNKEAAYWEKFHQLPSDSDVEDFAESNFSDCFV